MGDPGMNPMHFEPDELVADKPPAGRDVGAELRELVGVETYGRLLEAAKITGLPVLHLIGKSADVYTFIAAHQQHQWTAQMVRGDEVRPVPL